MADRTDASVDYHREVREKGRCQVESDGMTGGSCSCAIDIYIISLYPFSPFRRSSLFVSAFLLSFVACQFIALNGCNTSNCIEATV